MEKWKIIDDIEEIQNKVDEMGFAGSNEKELWTRDLIADYIVKKLSLCGVGSSLPSKDEKLIGNMCLSFRHDFGLLPKLIQDDLKRDCKNWLISYENNRK